MRELALRWVTAIGQYPSYKLKIVPLSADTANCIQLFVCSTKHRVMIAAPRVRARISRAPVERLGLKSQDKRYFVFWPLNRHSKRVICVESGVCHWVADDKPGTLCKNFCRANQHKVIPAHFLAETGLELALSPEALQALFGHPWPGNVRELQQVVTRAAHLAEGQVIGAGSLASVCQVLGAVWICHW